MAGETGLEPWRLTFGQLWAAARARKVDQWDRMAPLLALLANANRDRKKRRRPFTIYDFHPLRDKPKTKLTRATWRALKAFVPQRPRRLSGPTNYKL